MAAVGALDKDQDNERCGNWPGQRAGVRTRTHLSATVAGHIRRFPPTDVTLPWLTPEGEPVTKKFVAPGGNAVWRDVFNTYAWKPDLAAAGVIPEPEKGQRHAAAREHGMHALRYFYASVLLDAGENIKALRPRLRSDMGRSVGDSPREP